MKPTAALVLTALTILAIYAGCKKNPDTPLSSLPGPAPVSLDSILKCHVQTAADSLTIKNSLAGNWQWEYIKCYWNPEKANGEDYKNLSLSFSPDGILQVRLNGQVTLATTWKLGKLNDGYFKIITGEFVPYVIGRVLYCKDRIIFYDSYVDGCDNYFVKM